MKSGVLLFADRLPPLVGGMETHAGYFVEHFRHHARFPLVGVITKDATGRDVPVGRIEEDASVVFFNSGRWIESLGALRAQLPAAIFVYRTGGNEILKAPLERSGVSDHRSRQAFWADTLNATIDLLITNSEFTERRLRDMGITCRMVRCVGGANVAAPSPAPQARGATRLFCAARFVPYKHHDRLLNVVAKLSNMGHELRLCLAGDGPLLPEARKQAERLGIGQHVEFLGVLSNEAVCARVAAADLYVQFSADVLTEVPGGSYLHCEGMGRSILEAVSAGTFVIAGRGGALAEVVTPSRGLLVDLGRSDDRIAEQVGSLLTHPPRPPRTDEYSWSLVFDRYEAMWEALLETARRD